MTTSSNVSRETYKRIDRYVELLLKWNTSINLIARSTIDDVKKRHIDDSAAVYPLIPNAATKLIDLGSGGGLPVVVLAIIASGENRNLAFSCIEADIRKCQFLRTVARELDFTLNVISRRIDQAPQQQADVITARALAPLPKLLTFCDQHLHKDGTALLHKGENWKCEVMEAKTHWHFELEAHTNPISETSVILAVRDIRRA